MNLPKNGTELKQKLSAFGNNAAKKTLRTAAKTLSGAKAPYLNRYDNTGFLEGSGYFRASPVEGAVWRVGFAKDSILPADLPADAYIGSGVAFSPKKAAGKLDDQLVRAFALDDGSGRGIHVFAVIDGIGVALKDVRLIRGRLAALISEKNIESVQICATHCHSGVDTLGLSGDIRKAFKRTKGDPPKDRADRSIAGCSTDFMDFLIETTAEVIEKAVSNMTPGKLDAATADGAPYVQDSAADESALQPITLLRFTPENTEGKKLLAVFMANRPQNFNAGNHAVSADFPYYLCKTLEAAGFDAAFFQGADATVRARDGMLDQQGASSYSAVPRYGEAIAKVILQTEESVFHPVEPLLNVLVKETFLPVDNAALEFLGSIKMYNSALTRVTNGEDGKDFDYYMGTEIGLAELGTELKLALIPGSLSAGLAFGKTEKDFPYPSMQRQISGKLIVLGHCNDAIGRISPDEGNDDIFRINLPDAAASPGSRTAVEIAGAFARAAQAAEKIRIQ